MSGSIGGKLILVLTLCLAVITGISMLVDYRLSRADILQRLEAQTLDTIKGVVTDMENWLDAVEGSTLFLGRILQQQDYQTAQLEQMLKNIVENNEDTYGATIALNPALVDDPRGFAPYYFHRDGEIVYADLRSGKDNYWQRDWYRAAVERGEPVWVEPYFDREGGEALMTTFSVPVYRSTAESPSELYAVITADITLEELQNYLQRLRLGENGFGILLSRKGIILSAGDAAVTMRHYLDAAQGDQNQMAWREMVNSALAGAKLQRQLKCPDLAGQCIVHMGTLESTGWPVGVVHSQREMLAPLHEFRVKMALISLVTLFLLALAVYIVTRRITRPLTALAEASNQLARGELEMELPAARGQDEVAVLVRSFTTMKDSLKKYIADLESVTASRSRLEGELAAARDIQMSMLPRGGAAYEQTQAYTLWATVRPAKSVGGDLYSYYLDEDRLYIAVGDVSDKGVPAALFMAKTISLIQQMAGALADPTAAVTHLNNVLEQGNENCMFVTLFLGVVDLNTLELSFASGGHTPPVLVRADEVSTLEQDCGPPLGLAGEQEFPGNRVQLQPGDRLALWTDGIDEAFNIRQEMYGIPRLLSCLREQRQQTAEGAGLAVFRSVEEFSQGASQSDDIALLILDIADNSQQSQTSYRQDFTRGPRLVSRVLGWLESTLSEADQSPETIGELQLVAEEIVSNVDKYAGLETGDEIGLRVATDRASISLEVTDSGVAFNPLLDGELPPLGADIESAGIGGLGVHLITQLTEQQFYQRIDERNILRVVKRVTD